MLKKIISLTLTFAMLFTCVVFPASSASQEIGYYTQDGFTGVKAVNFSTDKNNLNFKIVGRNNPNNPTLFAWHASGVEFDVTGTTTVGVRIESYRANMGADRPLHVTINGKDVTLNGARNTETYDYEGNETWLANNPQPEKNCFIIQSGTRDYIFATDLNPEMTYTVRVTLDKESWEQLNAYACWMHAALVDNTTAANVTASANSEGRQILVLGDSITSANDLGGIHNSYHQITARAFGADTQVVSASGGYFSANYSVPETDARYTTYPNAIHIADSWNLTTRTNRIPELAGTAEASTDYSVDGIAKYSDVTTSAIFDPDLIVLNIGTNDLRFLQGYGTATQNSFKIPAANVETSRTAFKTDFEEFMKEVNGLYPNAKVVLCYGLMSRDDTLMEFYDTLATEYADDTGKKNLSTFFFDGFEVNADGKLDDSHPDKYAHVKAANLLIQEIKEVMPDWGSIDGYAYADNSNVVKDLPYFDYDENTQLPLGFLTANDTVVKLGETLTSRKTAVLKQLVNIASTELNGSVPVQSTATSPDTKITAEDGAVWEKGLYVQGAQPRIFDDSNGLRFIVACNMNVMNALEKQGATNIQRGILVAFSQYADNDMEIGEYGVLDRNIEKLFAPQSKTGTTYEKYTVAITGITQEYFDTEFCIRPYYKYTDKSGQEWTVYGEQFGWTLFEAANYAYSSGQETDDAKNWLYENIIKKCNGDNDDNTGNLFG